MPNIDHQEIAKFDNSQTGWWDRQGDFKALHDINPVRLEFIRKHTQLTGKKVLDVGCGGGILSEAMAKAGATVAGIDMNASALDAARQHAADTALSISYQHITAEEFAEQVPASFDVITCLEMLEHVPDPAAIIQACAALLKPQGRVFFSTINRNPKAYLHAIVGAEYLLKLIPKGTHDYGKFIRPSELAKTARNVGLDVEQLAGMHYNVVTQEYSLVDDVSVNYLMYCRKL